MKEYKKIDFEDYDYEKDLDIDLDNLHEEWRMHSFIRKKYADEVSRIDMELKKINERILVKKSQLVRKCKEENSKFTVQQVDSYVVEHEDYINMRDQQIKVEYDLNMAKNSLKAFDDRKPALENEVILWSRDYFSTPRERREVVAGKFSPEGVVAEAQRENLRRRSRRNND